MNQTQKIIYNCKSEHPDWTDEQICKHFNDSKPSISMSDVKRIKQLKLKKSAPASIPDDSFLEILQAAWAAANTSDTDLDVRVDALHILEKYADFFETT